MVYPIGNFPTHVKTLIFSLSQIISLGVSSFSILVSLLCQRWSPLVLALAFYLDWLVTYTPFPSLNFDQFNPVRL
jgi:hypothetical protein